MTPPKNPAFLGGGQGGTSTDLREVCARRTSFAEEINVIKSFFKVFLPETLIFVFKNRLELKVKLVNFFLQILKKMGVSKRNVHTFSI